MSRFAYGQTSSGKTYTLFGSEGDADVFSSSQNVSANAGIIPRAIRYETSFSFIMMMSIGVQVYVC